MGMSKRTALLSAVIVTFGLGTLYMGLNMKTPRPSKHHHSWDILIFTQTWPNTLCYTWKSSNPAHTCNLPSDKNIWTVHGVWPTKLGTIGPGFCNKSLVFNPESIYGIRDKLNQYWTDIEIPPSSNTTEGNSSSIETSHKKQSIYFHEWEKHGTCAVTLPALNTEFKYFYQGIEWSEKYNMRDVLNKSDIKINSRLNVADYWKAVKSVLNTNAWIECATKHDTKEQMLAEIRICFDKTLKLIDCDGIMTLKKSHALTNCDTMKPILYLDYVPEQNISTNANSTNSNSTSTDTNLTNSNSTVDEHSKLLYRLKRKVSDHSDEWITKSPRHFNRSHSYQPRTNTSYNQNLNRDLNRSNSYPSYIPRKEWDLLVFSQSWPYTFCHTWTVNSNTHTCNLPVNRNQWIVHGIWPTKIGAFGPFYCNNQTTFNLNALDTIIPELKNRWTEVKGSKTWSRKQEGELWRHEWMKHGTCSKSLSALDSELKYFNQGLDWSKKYVLNDLLEQGGIKPNGSYPVTQIWHTLRTGLGKNPHIDCYYESRTNKPYIDEVRICFNKALSLVDCDPFRRNSNKPSTNCPLDKEIFYMGAVF